MFSRRNSAIFLIVFGVAMIVLVVVWILLPVFHSPAKPVVQPPPFEESEPAPAPTEAPPPASVPILLNQTGIQERQAQEALRRLAQEFAARVGTYSNADEFAAIRQTYVQVTPEVKAYLEEVRQAYRKSHLLGQGSWGQTTRGLTSRITSPLPLLNRLEAEVLVQSQVVVETEQGTQPAAYQDVMLHFMRAEARGEWLVSRVEIRDSL